MPWYHVPAYDALAHQKLDQIQLTLHLIRQTLAVQGQTGVFHMATLQAILDKVRQQRTVIDSVHMLVQSLKAETDPAAVQQIIAELDANTGLLDDALIESTGGTLGGPPPGA